MDKNLSCCQKITLDCFSVIDKKIQVVVLMIFAIFIIDLYIEPIFKYK